MISERDLREWGFLVVVLVLGILLMLVAGAFAIRLNPAWQMNADMRSKIDPDGQYATSQGTRVLAPLEQDILTPVAWNVFTPTPTPQGWQPPTATSLPPTGTASPTTSPTATVTHTATASSPTPTRTATKTSIIYYNPTTTYTNIPARGTITILNDSRPNDALDFTFSGSLGAFTLDDDSDPALSNAATFGNLTAGSYTVTEAAVSGWDLGGLFCADPDGGSSINTGTRTATIDLDPGETVTCTFTNAKRGSITIVKDSLPNDAQDFAFTGTLGAFNLDDDADPALSNTTVFNDLPAGAYSVIETAVSSWDLTGLFCADPDGGSSINTGTRTASIDLDPGEAVTCTFTNTRRGAIVIVKDALPDNAQDFAFTRSFGAGFTLDDDSDPAYASTATFADLLPGSYTVTESTLAGWFLTGLNCADPDGGSSGSTATRTASIDLDAGETITCTFVNSQQGTVTIYKVGQPVDDPQTFAFSGGLGAFTLDDNADPTYSNAAIFTGLTAGSYTVTETAVAGWDLADLTCSDPDGGTTTNPGTRTITIDFDPGETINCTFTNARRGTINIIKNTVGGDGTFGFSGTLGAFNLVTSGGAASTVFSNQLPGSYIVSENDPSGINFTLTGLTCSDPDLGSSTNPGTRTATIDLDPGETVTCTYTNQRQGSITIRKDTLGGDDTFGFTSVLLGNFNLTTSGGTASTTFANLTPGTYAVSETSLPSGWDLTGAACSDGSPVTAIDMAAAEDVTCTFTNTKRGTLTIVKDSLPNDGQDFTFTRSFGADFSLDDDADPALSNTASFTLVPGTYTVSENDPTGFGFDLTGLSCTDGSPVDLGARSAAVTLSVGENVTCTFTNSKRGSITIIEDSVPDNAQDFDFTGTGPSGYDFGNGFRLDDDSNPARSNTATFNNLAVGSYTVTEASLGGWALANLSCSDPTGNSGAAGYTATITLDPGETVTCTFTNTDRGTIVIVKDAVPDSAQDFGFSGTLGSFTLDDDSDPAYSNTATFTSVLNGSYAVTEGAVGGWNMTSIICSDPDGGSSVNIGTQTATIDLDPAETVTCTFTNSAYTQINLGPGDDVVAQFIPEGSYWTTYLPTPVRAHGDGNWDLVFYEMYNAPCWFAYGSPICMDLIQIQISTDGNTWYTIFYYGNGQIYNSSIAGEPEADNGPIAYSKLILSPLMSLPTGIGIDIDNPILGLPTGANFYYLRIYSPPSTGDGCEVDAIDVFP